jgi:hypothetical protein
MIFHRELIQGTPAWRNLRCGKVTASEMHVLMTKKALTGELTEGSRTYLYRLLAEWALGQPYETASSAFMVRGSALEDRAWATYEFDHHVTTDKVGGIENDARTVWVSPDRLIGVNGGGELKILSGPEHIRAIFEGNDDHIIQIQANLWIAERDYWIAYFWHPTLPEVCIRVERDDDLIAAIASSVAAFLEHFETAKDKLRGIGVTPPAPTDFKALKASLDAEAAEFDALVAEGLSGRSNATLWGAIQEQREARETVL